MIDLDLIVVNYKTPHLLQEFITSIEDFGPTDLSFRVTVVDVEQESEDVKNPFGGKYLVKNNIGYGKSCNLASSLATGSRHLMLLNADTRLDNRGCLSRCVEFLDNNKDVAIVGPLQYDNNGTVRHSGLYGPWHSMVDHGFGQTVSSAHTVDAPVDSVSGSAFMIKRAVWDELKNEKVFVKTFGRQLGAFFPTPHFFEETGCAWNARLNGYQVWYLGSAQMVHQWHQSSPVGSQSRKYAISKAMVEEFEKVLKAEGRRG